jgi:hypothetical protein
MLWITMVIIDQLQKYHIYLRLLYLSFLREDNVTGRRVISGAFGWIIHFGSDAFQFYKKSCQRSNSVCGYVRYNVLSLTI